MSDMTMTLPLMDATVAKAGQRVMDASTGKVICTVKRDLHRYMPVSVGAFGDYAEGEKPWEAGEKLDPRCTRPTENGWQLFVEGEWRP